jgi:phosphoribosylaminoimidazole-succinocarboxamide synthase
MADTISQIDIPGVRKLKSGKIREVFDPGDALLFVATDRISAFDVILPNPNSEKGRVLTALSEFWFGRTRHIVENHFITSDFDEIRRRCSGASFVELRTASAKRRGADSALHRSAITTDFESLRSRLMLVRKCQPLPVECVVRGYLAGSGLKEYQQTRTVCGHRRLDRLQQWERPGQPHEPVMVAYCLDRQIRVCFTVLRRSEEAGVTSHFILSTLPQSHGAVTLNTAFGLYVQAETSIRVRTIRWEERQ